MVDLYGITPVTDWLDGKEPPVSEEDLAAMADPDSPDFSQAAHQAKWNPETFGMTPGTATQAVDVDLASFAAGMGEP